MTQNVYFNASTCTINPDPLGIRNGIKWATVQNKNKKFQFLDIRHLKFIHT